MREYLEKKIQGASVPKNTFEQYSSEVWEDNFSSLKFLCFIGMVVSYILVFLCLPFIRILEMISFYLSIAILFTIVYILLLTVFTMHKKLLLPIYYIFLILLFLIGIITGTYGGPTTNATTILIFMLIFPLCIIDRPWRLNCLLGVVTAVFCVADIYVKSGEILSLDIANTVVVCFLSMFFASMNVRRKLHGFELRRREREAASKKDAFINAIPTGIAIYEIRQTEVKQVFMNDSYF